MGKEELRRRKRKKEKQNDVVLDEIILKRKLKKEAEFAALMVDVFPEVFVKASFFV